MNILALDPAKYTGYCFGPSPQLLTYGTWNLGSGPKRLTILEEQIEFALKRFPACQVIAYEIAALGAKGFHAMHQHAELAGKIKELADRHSLQCWGFHIGTWKSIALGSGRAKPDRYRELVKLHYGHATSSCDEAAALGIWYAGQAGPPPEPKKKQAKRVKKTLAKRQKVFFK